jgi:uncharacterized membrane protein
LLAQFFIAIGLLQLLIGKKKIKFDEEYVIFALGFFVLSISAIIFPYISSFLNTTRLYQIALLLLSPFCVIGGVTLTQFFSKSVFTIFKKGKLLSKDSSLKVLAFFFAIFLLFNSGFIYEITKDHPNSIALSQKSILTSGTISEKIQFYNTITSEEEVSGATWLRTHRNPLIITYADFDCRQDLLLAFALITEDQSKIVYNTTERIDASSYFFFRKLNIIEGVMCGAQKIGHTDAFNATYIRIRLSFHSNLIYSNGGSEIYWVFRPVNMKEK